jgi:Fe2+ or Zn2+ uptake regulation protein
MVQLYRIENEIFRSAKIKTALQSSPKGGRRKIKFNLQEARNMRSMNMSWSQIASALSQKGERVSPSTVRRGLKIMNEEMAIV